MPAAGHAVMEPASAGIGVRLLCALLAPTAAAARFSIRGSSVYDGETRVKFKGIGLTCTEYMTKMGIDNPAKGEYPGFWAYTFCFGGPPNNASGTAVRPNDEPENLLKYLKPDSHGGIFQTRPAVKKVKFPAPFDEVVLAQAPEARPITRVPLTGSLYLYEDNHVLYQKIVDKIVQVFTDSGVAVILDLHWNCPDTSAMSPCTGAQAAPMALRHYGSKPGSVAFWDAISRKYANNGLVFYELFNEPWVMQYKDWYGGSDTYAGMKEMYQAIRKNDPEGLVVIGGKDQYALDAQSGLAFYLRYHQETGQYPTNILWNIHPYVGLGQGLEHSLGSALRLALALKTIGPVIFTEFGQYCCGGGDPCAGSGTCSNKKLGAYFVHNVVNMAEQYDISWVGWAWRGTGANNMHRPCLDGMAECSQPDVRDRDASGAAVLTDGRRAGADWKTVWAKFVAPSGGRIGVEDAHVPGIDKDEAQPAGFLPRPCIVPGFNLGDICGWGYGTNISGLSPSVFTAQSIYTSILPGLPGSCEAQGCSGFKCDTYTGPCHGKSGIAAVAASNPQPQPQQQQQQTTPGTDGLEESTKSNGTEMGKLLPPAPQEPAPPRFLGLAICYLVFFVVNWSMASLETITPVVAQRLYGWGPCLDPSKCSFDARQTYVDMLLSGGGLLSLIMSVLMSCCLGSKIFGKETLAISVALFVATVTNLSNIDWFGWLPAWRFLANYLLGAFFGGLMRGPTVSLLNQIIGPHPKANYMGLLFAIGAVPRVIGPFVLVWFVDLPMPLYRADYCDVYEGPMPRTWLLYGSQAVLFLATLLLVSMAQGAMMPHPALRTSHSVLETPLLPLESDSPASASESWLPATPTGVREGIQGFAPLVRAISTESFGASPKHTAL